MRGQGLPAVRLASVAMTSFRDACAQPGLSLPEIARVVDRSVTRAAGEKDFVTAVFAKFDPRGWLQLVNCGHPPPLRLADGDLRALSPAAYATPLGLHPVLLPKSDTGRPRGPAAVTGWASNLRFQGGGRGDSNPRPPGPQQCCRGKEAAETPIFLAFLTDRWASSHPLRAI
jgi:stage II sporulation SpoE-like protein